MLAMSSYPDSTLAYDDRFVSMMLVLKPMPEHIDEVFNVLQAQSITTIVSIDGSPAGLYAGWSMVEPLLGQGVIEPIVSSEPTVLTTKSFTLQEALLSGEIGSQAELETAVNEATNSLTLQFHLYRVR